MITFEVFDVKNSSTSQVPDTFPTKYAVGTLQTYVTVVNRAFFVARLSPPVPCEKKCQRFPKNGYVLVMTQLDNWLQLNNCNILM